LSKADWLKLSGCGMPSFSCKADFLEFFFNEDKS
jgi:hypothetical protein